MVERQVVESSSYVRLGDQMGIIEGTLKLPLKAIKLSNKSEGTSLSDLPTSFIALAILLLPLLIAATKGSTSGLDLLLLFLLLLVLPILLVLLADDVAPLLPSLAMASPSLFPVSSASQSSAPPSSVPRGALPLQTCL